MLINVRCVTCGTVIADKWEYYKREVAKLEKEFKDAPKNTTFGAVQTKEILDHLGLHKYCCRRMLIANVELIDEI